VLLLTALDALDLDFPTLIFKALPVPRLSFAALDLSFRDTAV
jgi:hypothetical protein